MRADELDAPSDVGVFGTEEVKVPEAAGADELNAPSVADTKGTDEIKVPSAGETASNTRTFVGGGPNKRRGLGTGRGLLKLKEYRRMGPPEGGSDLAGLAAVDSDVPHATGAKGGATSPAWARCGPGPGGSASADDGTGSGHEAAGGGPENGASEAASPGPTGWSAPGGHAGAPEEERPGVPEA